MTILITGIAGFIGFHTAKKLIEKNIPVIGIDNLNDYYDVNLKKSRLDELYKITASNKEMFFFEKGDISESSIISKIFEEYEPSVVINLAAQAGVRYSIKNPSSYVQSNLVGFANILEYSKKYKVKHLIYASSSSVYGGNKKMPFSEDCCVDHPLSIYGATKKSNELMAHSYSHLFNLPVTGLRFFTVYCPWGRPDMALFLFTKAIINNEEIEVFNYGNMERDFTYIDDIVQSIYLLITKPPKENNNFDKLQPNPSKSWAPYRIFNIGNSKPVQLIEYIEAIEKALNKKSKKKLLPMQPGDVSKTFANTKELESWIGFKPQTSIQEGIDNFVKWYLNFYS